MPMLSVVVTLCMNIEAMVRLTGVVPIVIVGVFIALTAKVILVRPPPGILFLTESMSMASVLEKRGESVIVWLEGGLAW